MSKPVEAVMIGAGARAQQGLGLWALENPEDLRYVAVAEPVEDRRLRFAEAHGIPPERCFASADDLFAAGQLAPALVNCTCDLDHLDTGLGGLEAGYHTMIEKPMAHTLAGNIALVQLAEERNRVLMTCHGLRYIRLFSVLNHFIHSGRLGQVVSFEHRENVWCWMAAHAYVRGNWRNAEVGTPMILSKCCHDLDILYWNLGPTRKLQSFGSLQHFRPENAPPGAPKRCTDGCPVSEECPYYAPRGYASDGEWAHKVLRLPPSPEGIDQELRTGPFGRCVYHCDNTAVDTQVVNMEFENGATGALFMHGHSWDGDRTMRYDGTRASLRAKWAYPDEEIEIYDHRTQEKEQVDVQAAWEALGPPSVSPLTEFVRVVREFESAGETESLTSGRDALESHLMGFAAEESRLGDKVIDMAEFRRRLA